MRLTRHYIEVCRWENLVYLRTLKCASTFFYWNFTKHLGWTETHWNAIDWQNDHVFTHMLDPVERRHKAIAERLHMHRLGSLYLENPDLQAALQHAWQLDEHNESYCTRYGTAVNHIDWIPLSDNNRENIRRTEKLIEFHQPGTMPIQWDMNFAHYADHNKKAVETRLRQSWQEGLYKGLIEWQQFQYADDMNLYQRVVQRFNALGESWSDMSWLPE